MPIIKAVIYFSICHLIVCQHTDDCHIKNGLKHCVTSDSQLRFSCHGQTLEIHVLTNDSANALSGHDNITSINRMWNRCIFNSKIDELDDPLDTNLTVTVSTSHNNITAVPDDYFCHLPIIYIRNDHNLLNDTTKLGFSSLDNCEIRCETKLVALFLDNNPFEKVSNDSFCGLDGLQDLHMNYCQLEKFESDAFVHLKSLRFLSLKYNNITFVSPGVFRQQKNTLTTLLMSHNKLDSISIMELKNLTALQHLNLAHNQIDVIPNGLFDEMKQLKDLNLGHNSIKTLQGVLTRLTNLQRLNIVNNVISEIRYEHFKNLLKLTFIVLDNNPINTFEPQALTNCVNMSYIKLTNTSLSTVPNFITRSETFQNLFLTKNRIAYIRIGTFDKGANIKRIDLSYNRLTDISNIFNICTVEDINLNHNRITKIDLNDFSPRLVTLSLAHNRIHTIDIDLFQQRWRLRHVDMSFNRLNGLNNLSLPESVLNFDVRNNNISSMSFDDAYLPLICNKMDKTVIDMENNAFDVIDERLFVPTDRVTVLYYVKGNPLKCSCDNQWLSTSRYVIDRLSLRCQQENQTVLLSTARYNCNVRHNNEVYSVKTCNVWCPKQCNCRNVGKSLIHVDCTSQNITNLPLTIPFEFTNVNKLRVYLDNNLLPQIHNKSFDGFDRTIELYLNSTGISEIDDGSFDHLTMLDLLDLEDNNLTYISDSMFKNLINLTQLFLSHNEIETIEPNAFPSQLQVLYLHNNRLVDFSVWQLDHLSRLWKLSVHTNNWSCECNFIEKFQTWLQNNSYIIAENDEIFCVYSNVSGMRLPLMTIDVSRCHITDKKNVEVADETLV